MIIFYLLIIIFIIRHIVIEVNNQKLRNPKNENEDIKTIDGITYLIKDNSSYVMYKLDSAFTSKYLKSWTFTKKSNTEGELVFGALNIATNGSGNKDYGHTYNVKIESFGDNTLLHMTYIGKTGIGNMGPSKLLTQAYHFFMLEQFDVIEIRENSNEHD
ncbi:MAG: hypothetical protein K6G87_14135 [Butyrivibrio sp.]|uniref:hypothetical protein n=1 Tax=Butyrivibrio sp. TaxID=28121 RepID=UPI0025EBD016|nr:hypothetical protein [Butyrivibrio sp.]MCR5772356.1 hypothetical protein [Butyrivibrio sp.]